MRASGGARRGNARFQSCLELGGGRKLRPMHPCPRPQSRLGTAKPVHPFRNQLVPLLSALALARFAAAGQNSPAAAGPPQTVRQIKVQPDQAPDCTSLKTWSRSRR